MLAGWHNKILSLVQDAIKSLIASQRNFNKRYLDVKLKAAMQINTEHHDQISFAPHARHGDFDEAVRPKQKVLMHVEDDDENNSPRALAMRG